MRCINAHRPCSGYEQSASSTFRQYENLSGDKSPKFISAARKCSLPKRIPVPGTNIIPEDNIPVSQPESDNFALRAFFYDYCIISTNSNLSRGYLSGLEMMLQRLGPTSDLAKACQAVMLATHGKPLQRPQLVNKAELYYQELLGSLAKSIDSPPFGNAVEEKLVAMLLGLYQAR